MSRSIDRQRRALERWLADRTSAWEGAVTSVNDTVVAPALARAGAEAGEQAKVLRLAQNRLQEEAGALRTLRNQLSQNLMFDLKRRLRQLQSGG